MNRTEKIIVITGAGVVAVLVLLARRGFFETPNPNSVLPGSGLKIKQQPQPTNNIYAGCKCASTQTTTPDNGDYSAGGYQQVGDTLVAPDTPGY